MNTRIVLLVASALTGAAITWWATSTSYTSDIATIRADHAKERAQWEADRAAISTEAQKETDNAIKRMKAAQDALADLDTKKRQELANAERENNSLRDAVAAGDKRVRILAANLAKAEHSAGSHAAGDNPAASCLGDGAGIELSATAGRTVYDIRAGILSDQAKLSYLQVYVRDVVRQCAR